MLNSKFTLDRLWPLLCFMLVIWPSLYSSALVQAADGDDQELIAFPSQCECSLTMTCKCCVGAVFKVMSLNKTLCMSFKINIFKASVDVTVTLDNEQVSKFTLDSKTTPTFCVPVISDLTPMAICLKMSTKLSGLSNINMCPSFYSSFSDNQLLAFDFPCLKLGTDGLSFA
ncbi:uncharacterized protein LOC6574807 [Drosophila mojavensis]|nr:uncharacterized protein LOC6574807 [Drosophila mojavensis]